MINVPVDGVIRVRRGTFHSLRFQVAFVSLLGVILPLVIAVGIPSKAILASGAIATSATLALVAALGMIALLRQIGRYPSVSTARWILPSLATFYGFGLAAINFARLDHSNTILALSFAGTLFSRYAIATLNIRGPQPTYFLVPGGRIGLLDEVQGLAFVGLDRPELPIGRLRGVAIIADLRQDHPPEWERFLAEVAIQGYPVFHVKQFWEAMTGRVQLEQLSENSFGALLPSLGYTRAKRAIDSAASLLALPVLLPLFAAFALAIRLESPGPAFFRQQRMGYRGRVFQIFKFRTMSVTHDGGDAAISITEDGDARITRVGAFLRRTRLDELPQVFNILRGEMSWIGPRPEALSLSQVYELAIPFYRYRHIVRPGITGWAQVSQGHVATVREVHTKLQFDFYYIKNISYWLDVLIAFKTIRTMIAGFGAR